MRRWLLLMALLLPLGAMLASIATRQSALSAGSDWVISVSGYDPRDPLRGRYIRFQYDWLLAGEPARCLRSGGCDLCLDRDTGPVRATAVPIGATCRHRVDVAASRLTVRPGWREEGPAVVFGSRLFVSEASAPVLEAQLLAGPMAVAARLDSNGRLVPRALIPAPEARDAPPAGPAGPVGAPPPNGLPPR